MSFLKRLSLTLIFAASQLCFAPGAFAADTQTMANVLTPGAREAAALLNITPQVERLILLKQTQGANQDPLALSDEQMNLRVYLLDKIVGQSLEVRMVCDRIDRELAWAYSGKGSMEARRQRNLNLLFAANFLQGGILGTIAGPEFLHGDARAGAELLLTGSGVGLGLSTLALLESRSGSKKVDGETTVLADIFELKHEDKQQHHPEVVMKYLNSVPPLTVNGATRRQTLIAGWKKGHYMHAKDERQMNTLAALQVPGTRQRENIGLLANRIRMLYDVQWTVEQLDGELLELLRATD
ncbi:MAG: hypothetical protein JSS83_07755 [Cyanobacteria bacterium SZAS LIN-3]|nr:hypothetical protein [Cyanobacteria bacterium SZAS LIN-3]MBS2005458.1 hypothetical protein [Cyanobacteria bacterium SZAS TMP-1]